MNTIITNLNLYHFDLREEGQKEEYNALVRSLKAQGLRKFHTHGGRGHYFPFLNQSGEVSLETKHLYFNQWNSDLGRIFDWAEDYIFDNPHIKRGHFLTITQEMRDVRDCRWQCGYCSASETHALGVEPENLFCQECYTSEYLTEDDLFLTRLHQVSDASGRPPLTEAEYEVLTLRKGTRLQVRAQRFKQKVLEERDRSLAQLHRKVEIAHMSYGAECWLYDRGAEPSLVDNMIYYDHLKKFSFGWKGSLSKDHKMFLAEHLPNFPWPHQIKEK